MSRGAQRADEVLREDQSTRKALGRTFLDELVRSIPKRSDFSARCCQLARPVVSMLMGDPRAASSAPLILTC